MCAGDGGNFRRTASAPIPPPSTFSVSLNLPKLSCVLLASRFLSAAPPFLVVHIFSGQRFADGSGLDEVGGGGSSLVQQLRLLCFFFLYPFLFLPVAPILSIPALSVFSFCFLFVSPKKLSRLSLIIFSHSLLPALPSPLSLPLCLFQFASSPPR